MYVLHDFEKYKNVGVLWSNLNTPTNSNYTLLHVLLYKAI